MKALNFFDLFSQTPSLKVNGNTRLATIFGSIVGFLAISVLITGISFILNEYFSRLHYNLNSYTDNSARPDIDLSKFKLGFLLTDPLGNQFPDRERLFEITATFWDIHIPLLGDNSTQTVNISNIPKIKFNEYNNSLFNDEAELYAKLYDSDCLDLETINKNLSGIWNNFGR